MKSTKRWLVAMFLLVNLVPAEAQQAKPDVAKHEQKVRDIVAFLEYVLNTLGNNSTSARDKDVLVTESYNKIFRDTKVQVEDDLDENRNVITNKDVQAYLKDVDFFFEHAEFEFTIEDIQGEVNANGQVFYKVSLARNLKGTTVAGKKINNTIPRYIEINYNPDNQDLKVVSIYTHEFDEREALKDWWGRLSYEWQSIFKRKLRIVADSMRLADIKNISSIDELDISHNQYIQTIEPLAQLINLKVLNLSHTAVADLSPIRNLTELTALNLAHAPVSDLSALRYAGKMKKFNVSHTGVSDISVVERMPALEHLDISGTGVADLAPIRSLTALQHLNVEATKVSDLSPVASLHKMKELNASGTFVNDLAPLAGLKQLAVLDLDSAHIANLNALGSLENLKVLSVNHTLTPDLQPLHDLPNLEKVYCDRTPINRELATAFMASRPGVIVIFDSEDLKSWWTALPVSWQDIFRTMTKAGANPAKDELARITGLDSVNLGGSPHVRSLEPLQRLHKLQVIVAANTAIDDLSPLSEQKNIRYLDISNTRVSDISVVKQFVKIEVLRADSTGIENIAPLSGIGSLKKLYVDKTGVHDLHVQEFLSRNPRCLVVYKTWYLERWWSELSESWKEIFQAQLPLGARPAREELHRLAELQTLHFENVPVSDLSPLQVFVCITELSFSATRIADLSPLAELRSLKSLRAANSPIYELKALGQLTGLESVDISNTPADDLRALSSLKDLKTFNCSGTQVRRLDPLASLPLLESLDCSNTNVRRLDPVSHLSLKTLKCYNTRIPDFRVEDFKEDNPDCEVVYYR